MGAAVRETYPVATRISTNATTPIPGARLGRIIIGTAGSAWLLSVQDAAGNVKFVIAAAFGTLPIGWEFGQGGCRIVSSGTTPGDVMVLSE